MERLTRTRVGDFTSDRAYRLSQIEEIMSEDKISDVILTPEEIFEGNERIRIPRRPSVLLRNGNTIPADLVRDTEDGPEHPEDRQRFRMYDCEGIFCAVYEYDASAGLYRPYKMFLNP